MCMGADEDSCDDVAALETAIELASSLGVDTGAAEEHAASARGLLSLRVSWGSTACFMLLPSGMPFFKVREVVARRFGFMEGELGTQRAAPVFELWYREGSEFHHAHDEATWETCLYHALSQLRRVELCLETVAGVHPPLRRRVRRGTPPCQAPFMVTGTRLSTPCHMHGEAGESLHPLPFVANGGFRSVPPSWRGQPARKAQARRSPRPPLPSARERRQQACLHGSTGLAVSGGRLTGMATRQPTSASKTASRGGPVAPLELGGRTPRHSSPLASLSVLGSSPQRPHYAGA